MTRIVFGEHTRQDAEAAYKRQRTGHLVGPDEPIPADRLVDTHPAGNPCVSVYGAGPEGATCKTCVHLLGIHRSKTYYKCRQRPITGGPGTDHRVNWPACSRYEENEA